MSNTLIHAIEAFADAKTSLSKQQEVQLPSEETPKHSSS